MRGLKFSSRVADMVIEAGVFPRETGRTIEDACLGAVDRNGHWK